MTSLIAHNAQVLFKEMSVAQVLRIQELCQEFSNEPTQATFTELKSLTKSLKQEPIPKDTEYSVKMTDLDQKEAAIAAEIERLKLEMRVIQEDKKKLDFDRAVSQGMFPLMEETIQEYHCIRIETLGNIIVKIVEEQKTEYDNISTQLEALRTEFPITELNNMSSDERLKFLVSLPSCADFMETRMSKFDKIQYDFECTVSQNSRESFRTLANIAMYNQDLKYKFGDFTEDLKECFYTLRWIIAKFKEEMHPQTMDSIETVMKMRPTVLQQYRSKFGVCPPL